MDSRIHQAFRFRRLLSARRHAGEHSQREKKPTEAHAVSIARSCATLNRRPGRDGATHSGGGNCLMWMRRSATSIGKVAIQSSSSSPLTSRPWLPVASVTLSQMAPSAHRVRWHQEFSKSSSRPGGRSMMRKVFRGSASAPMENCRSNHRVPRERAPCRAEVSELREYAKWHVARKRATRRDYLNRSRGRPDGYSGGDRGTSVADCELSLNAVEHDAARAGQIGAQNLELRPDFTRRGLGLDKRAVDLAVLKIAFVATA